VEEFCRWFNLQSEAAEMLGRIEIEGEVASRGEGLFEETSISIRGNTPASQMNF